MKITYAALGGAGPAYEIEADRHGSYTIRQDGVVLKRVTSITHYPGKPLWGSRRLAEAALREAQATIESHHAMQT